MMASRIESLISNSGRETQNVYQPWDMLYEDLKHRFVHSQDSIPISINAQRDPKTLNKDEQKDIPSSSTVTTMMVGDSLQPTAEFGNREPRPSPQEYSSVTESPVNQTPLEILAFEMQTSSQMTGRDFEPFVPPEPLKNPPKRSLVLDSQESVHKRIRLCDSQESLKPFLGDSFPESIEIQIPDDPLQIRAFSSPLRELCSFDGSGSEDRFQGGQSAPVGLISSLVSLTQSSCPSLHL